MLDDFLGVAFHRQTGRLLECLGFEIRCQLRCVILKQLLCIHGTFDRFASMLGIWLPVIIFLPS